MVLAPFKLQIDKHTIFQQIFTSNQCLKKIILKRVDVVISHQNLAHQRGYNTLLLGHWYEIMAFFYVKSILTEISASREDKRVLQKSKVIRIKFFEQMEHATDV